MEPGAIDREPVTSVATKVVPTSPSGAAAEPPALPVAEPAVDEAAAEDDAADEEAAAEELPAAGVEVVLLAHAVRPVSSAIAAAAASRLVERIFVLTCTDALVPPPSRLCVPPSASGRERLPDGFVRRVPLSCCFTSH